MKPEISYLYQSRLLFSLTVIIPQHASVFGVKMWNELAAEDYRSF